MPHARWANWNNSCSSCNPPYGELTPELLQAVVEAFILRESPDNGEREVPLSEKVTRVIAQLKRGEAKIVFDPQSESVNIVRR